jgi:hypothetical protein
MLLMGGFTGGRGNKLLHTGRQNGKEFSPDMAYMPSAYDARDIGLRQF